MGFGLIYAKPLRYACSAKNVLTAPTNVSIALQLRLSYFSCGRRTSFDGMEILFSPQIERQTKKEK